ncbi:Lactate utilization protein [Lentibacillus sp. JNUCC-1]|uniref:LutC/YkgG family protein n=1 Tax=Lentibacillus sp. JNUCC-1 TaxID=2654513 RepID=UPI0012E806EA|nr:lactate utilization protein C [Lentibacillus sp. JNUCC-1]MUV36977.1 Lactate utilization protein [Lentibacillus sp. JNUCC-1]
MAKGTVHNREAFLDHVRNRLGGARRTHVERPEWTYQPQRAVYRGKTPTELRTIFKENSVEKDTHVIETTKDELAETVRDVMQSYGGGPMVATRDERFDTFGLSDVFEDERVYIWDADAGVERNVQEARKANVGFFVSDVSLAESGTVTQLNDRNNARSVSLLPVTYVAIVPESTIVPRMTQATDMIHGKVKNGEDLSPYINFNSGPSNSADIEMNIVKGVHGPVQAVHIIVRGI